MKMEETINCFLSEIKTSATLLFKVRLLKVFISIFINGIFMLNYHSFLAFFCKHSSASITFLPQRSHVPSSVIPGCLGASPPQIPHFTIHSPPFIKSKIFLRIIY